MTLMPLSCLEQIPSFPTMPALLTPMIFMSGVYYPVSQLPSWLQVIAAILPLGAAVEVVRPLLLGELPDSVLPNILILLAYCLCAFYLATIITRRRLLK